MRVVHAVDIVDVVDPPDGPFPTFPSQHSSTFDSWNLVQRLAKCYAILDCCKQPTNVDTDGDAMNIQEPPI